MLTYQAALDWLYSFIDSEKTLPRTAAEFNLPRTTALLALLGNPHLNYPAVVVAGTKGKGSTCAMLESIVRAAGLKTGLWSSPHLHSYRERLQVNRELASQEALAALVEQVQPLISQLDPELGRPSTYEIGVVLGLTYFAQAQVNLAILEIGLGGRFDAINSVTPVLSIISSISYDHMSVLGNTLAAIAGEKAGITKQHVPMLTTVQKPEAANVIAERAQTQQAPFFLAATAGLQEAQSGTLVDYPLTIRAENIGLAGEFQLENARLAASAGMLLREIGFPISDDAIREGLKTAQWPGRFEQIAADPTVIVDGAHNGDSARVLMRALQTIPHDKLILVLGTSADKDVEGIARELGPKADIIVLTKSRHPRSLTIEELQRRIEPYTQARIETAPDIPPALDKARSLTGTHDLICITGSLFVVAAAREAVGLGQAD